MDESRVMARLEMVLSVPADRAAAGAHVRDWLSMGLDVMGGPLAAAAWARAPLPDPAKSDPPFYGEPGQAWLDLTVYRTSRQKTAKGKPLSTSNWTAFLSAAAELPDRAIIRMRTLDHESRPYGVPAFDVRTDVYDDWVQLTGYVATSRLADTSGYADPLLAAWLELAHRCDPWYGELAGGVGNRTELEAHLGANGLTERNLPTARERRPPGRAGAPARMRRLQPGCPADRRRLLAAGDADLPGVRPGRR
jgi:hypothetical protein